MGDLASQHNPCRTCGSRQVVVEVPVERKHDSWRLYCRCCDKHEIVDGPDYDFIQTSPAVRPRLDR